MNYYDIVELAWRAIGKTEGEAEKEINNGGDIDQEIFERYECSFETFEKITNDLVKFTQPLQSPLTKTVFQAFVDPKKHRAIVKRDIKI
jgi:hypothetical protein